MPFDYLPDYLVGLAQAGFALIILFGLGRYVPGTGREPGLAILSGWGVVVIGLTLAGVTSSLDLHGPALILALAGLIGLVRHRERWSVEGARVLCCLGLLVPLVLVMAPAMASQADVFLNLLPNAAYLIDYGQFPTQNRPESFSFLPVAPYNTQFLSLLGSLGGGGLAANGLAQVTVLLHGVAGLIMAMILVDESLDGGLKNGDLNNGAGAVRGPGWSVMAVGMLAATVLNPGFLPRVNLSGYGEMPIALCLLAAGWLWLRVMTDLNRDWVSAFFWPLALTLVVLINIKQQSLGVFLAFLVGAGGSLCLGGGKIWRGLRVLALAALPAIILYLVWRGFVAGEFPDGELRPLPFSEWQWGNLPQIFQSIAKVWVQKPWLYLGLIFAVLVLVHPVLRRGVRDGTRRVALLLVLTALAYNGFLLLTYIGHFPGRMSVEAHSYFRYTTHLSLLIMAVMLLAGRDLVLPWLEKRVSLRRAGGGVAIALMLIWPVAGQGMLRFDQDQPQPILRAMTEAMAPSLRPDERIGLVLPGDNGSVGAMMRGILRYEKPRKARLQVAEFDQASAADGLKAAAETGLNRVILSCSHQSGLDLPEGAAALLDRGADGWHPTLIWLYEPFNPDERWRAMVSPAPLCRF